MTGVLSCFKVRDHLLPERQNGTLKQKKIQETLKYVAAFNNFNRKVQQFFFQVALKEKVSLDVNQSNFSNLRIKLN